MATPFNPNHSRCAAFTLIKPLIVVVFLGCLMAVVTQMYVAAITYVVTLS